MALPSYFMMHCQQKLQAKLLPDSDFSYRLQPTETFLPNISVHNILLVGCFMFCFQYKLDKLSSNLRRLGLWGTEHFNSYSLKDHMQKVHVSEFTLAVASFKHPSGVISGQCPVLGAVQRHNWSHNLPPPLTRPRHLTREPWTVMGMLCRTAVTVTVAMLMILV